MRFERLYPVELLFRGEVGSFENLSAKERIAKLREFFATDKPDVTIDKIVEEQGLTATKEKDFVYRVSGFSTNPGVR
jgi:hypothetical protein